MLSLGLLLIQIRQVYYIIVKAILLIFRIGYSLAAFIDVGFAHAIHAFICKFAAGCNTLLITLCQAPLALLRW